MKTTNETYTFPAGTTLAALKAAEKQAQRAYSKGEGTQEDAAAASRAVYRFKEEVRWKAEHKAEQALARRLNAALAAVEGQLFEVATSEPSFFVNKTDANVICWGTGDGYNSLLVHTLATPDQMREIHGTRSVRAIDSGDVILPEEDVIAALEAAAKK